VITPAHHWRLHAVSKQNALGCDGVAVFRTSGQLARGIDPAGGVDVTFGVLRLGHRCTAAVAVEHHAGGVGIQEPGVETCLGLHGLHPRFQQRPHTARVGVVPGLLKTGLELAALQHNRAVAVGIAAKVGGGPIGVFRGG